MKSEKIDWSVQVLAPSAKWNESWDGILVVVDASTVEKKSLSEALTLLERPMRELLVAYAQRFDFKAKAGESLSFDTAPERRVVIASVASAAEIFDALTLSRESWDPLFSAKCKHVGVDLRAISDANKCGQLGDAFASGFAARRFEPPKFAASSPADKRKAPTPKLTFATPSVETADACKQGVAEGLALTVGTNYVRYLSILPTESLTPSIYVSLLKDKAREVGLQFTHYDEKQLLKRKAGAFLAVTRGADDHGGGIVSLKYSPKKAKKGGKKIALVGKGITFDTGGHNLKTEGHMLGMNGDMGGSAVAAALVVCAAENDWPFEVEAYLAIAENSIGPKAFRCNEVVSASNGKTIEVIDTDAEGRMVLSDTLVLAAEKQPDLIVDFATLTGSCIRAIGRGFSGVYTNRRELHPELIEAGRQSGERVWPFPIDADFGKALKSDIADIKQCRASGGVDHIEAAYFLSQFVPEKNSWVHTDLSAIENDEGLAHVPPKNTGFGVRFAARLMQMVARKHWGIDDFRIA